MLGAGDSPDTFYRNDRDGAFTKQTPALVTPSSNGEGATWFDCDNDGWLDVFIPRNPGNDLLFRGSPGGTFQSMNQAQAGSIVAYSSYFGGLNFDYDDDGWPDLWVTPFSSENLNLQCRLHHNEGQGVFREVTDCALATQMSQFSTSAGQRWLVSTIGDFDNDGDLDVFAGNGQDGYRARLYRNDGNGVFIDVAADAGVDRPLNALVATFADSRTVAMARLAALNWGAH